MRQALGIRLFIPLKVLTFVRLYLTQSDCIRDCVGLRRPNLLFLFPFAKPSPISPFPFHWFAPPSELNSRRRRSPERAIIREHAWRGEMNQLVWPYLVLSSTAAILTIFDFRLASSLLNHYPGRASPEWKSPKNNAFDSQRI